MNNNSIKGNITIQATPVKVWDAITNPAKIALYTGSETHTDWLEGSPITWLGEMHGIKYENKGHVQDHEPYDRLRYSYWSGMGGDADLPENYSEVTYLLEPINDNETRLTYERTNIATELETQIFAAHLPSMLEEIKKIAEQ